MASGTITLINSVTSERAQFLFEPNLGHKDSYVCTNTTAENGLIWSPTLPVPAPVKTHALERKEKGPLCLPASQTDDVRVIIEFNDNKCKKQEFNMKANYMGYRCDKPEEEPANGETGYTGIEDWWSFNQEPCRISLGDIVIGHYHSTLCTFQPLGFNL
jgi:hypothetical protein